MHADHGGTFFNVCVEAGYISPAVSIGRIVLSDAASTVPPVHVGRVGLHSAREVPQPNRVPALSLSLDRAGIAVVEGLCQRRGIGSCAYDSRSQSREHRDETDDGTQPTIRRHHALSPSPSGTDIQ